MVSILIIISSALVLSILLLLAIGTLLLVIEKFVEMKRNGMFNFIWRSK